MEPGSFIEPEGMLSEGMFPGGDVEELVTAWLTDAEARTDDEAKQRAWVYYRAYTSIADRLNAGLASERKGDAAAAIHPSQLRYWRQRAAEQLTFFRGGSTSHSGVTALRSAW